MGSFIFKNPGTCFFLVLGALMNIGSRINDAYTFINAGLPHQVYEGAGAAIFFLTVVLLLYRWDRSRPTTASMNRAKALVPSKVPEERDSYRNETVHLADLLEGDDPIIAGKSFHQCLIVGPAFVNFHSQCVLEFCSVPFDPPKHFVTIKEGAGIFGAIILSRMNFRQCQFVNVSFIGTAQDTKKMLTAFSQKETQGWEAKNLVG